MTTGTSAESAGVGSAGSTEGIGSVAIGVELGGKRTAIALIDQEGVILHRCDAKTLWGRPASATVEPSMRGIETLLAHASAEGYCVSGIGVSIPGAVDETSSRPLFVPTLPSLNGFPLAEMLQTRFGLPAQLYIDVDAASWGEYRFSVGKQVNRLLFLSLNAVVGAALIIDGRPERSNSPSLGHTSHMPITTNGPRCGCGKRGCINTLISIDAIQKMVQRAQRRDEESSLLQRLSRHELFSPQLLAVEAERGDSVALQVYHEMSRWFVAALVRYIDLFAPEMLLLGGSVLNASPLLFNEVRGTLLAQYSLEERDTLQIVPAQLGEDAALIGAALFMHSQALHSIELPAQSSKQQAHKKRRKPQSRIALHYPDDMAGDGSGLSTTMLADAIHPPLSRGNAVQDV